MDEPLIFVRVVHFAATLSAGGVALFDIFITQPALPYAMNAELRAAISRRLAWIAWIALVLNAAVGCGVVCAGELVDQRSAARQCFV